MVSNPLEDTLLQLKRDILRGVAARRNRGFDPYILEAVTMETPYVAVFRHARPRSLPLGLRCSTLCIGAMVLSGLTYLFIIDSARLDDAGFIGLLGALGGLACILLGGLVSRGLHDLLETGYQTSVRTLWVPIRRTLLLTRFSRFGEALLASLVTILIVGVMGLLTTTAIRITEGSIRVMPLIGLIDAVAGIIVFSVAVSVFREITAS